jgi:hypothetical protein
MTHKFKTADAYPPQPVELTPARRNLAELLAKRDELGKESDILQGRIARLARAKEAIAAIESELVTVGIQEAAAMLLWVEADDGSAPPTGHAERRADLEAQLQPARAAARAGDAATASLSSQITRVNNALTNLSAPLVQASAMIVREEMTPLLGEMAAAVTEIERCKARINAGLDYLNGAGQSLPGGMGYPIAQEFEKFSIAARDAGSARPTDRASHAAAFASLGARLGSDPSAKLEGVQS